MNTVMLPRILFQLIAKPSFSKKELFALFYYFQHDVMRGLSRAIYLPSLGSWRPVYTGAHSLRDDLKGVVFPNGVFHNEVDVKEGEGLYNKFFWGITTSFEWVIWKIKVRRHQGDGDNFFTSEHFFAAECVFKSECFEDFAANLQGMIPGRYPLISMWDALHIEVDSLVKKREIGLDEAKKAMNIVGVIHEALIAQHK